MAILQALFSLLSRSLGKILNAIFGWAVVALFGQPRPKEKTILSGLVALAAAWPLLILGIFLPRVATTALAFVPPSAQGPAWLMRTIWLALTLVVPAAVGLVVASKAPPGTPAEPFVTRVLRGFPITAGLAAAFLVMFATIPVLQIVSALRRHKSEHVPLMTSADAYAGVTDRLQRVLDTHAIAVQASRPPLWLALPVNILLALGGKAFRGFVPEQLAYWRGRNLEIALYPNDLLLRGTPRTTAWVHGLAAEDLARSPALQTFHPSAQQIEREIRRVWAIFDEYPRAHTQAPRLVGRLREITRELGGIDVPYDEWSILYRQCAQLSRALEGKPQLLAQETEGDMTKEVKAEDVATDLAAKAATRLAVPSQPGIVPAATDAYRDARAMSTPHLMGETAREAITLVRAEIELVRAELKADLRSEVQAAKGLGAAAVCALAFLELLLVAGALALAQVMPAWAAALAVAGAVGLVGAIAATAGWKHVKKPLERTRKTLKEDLQWMKERTA